MGRIDEALRRVDGYSSVGGGARGVNDPAETFESPWSFRGGAAAAVAEPDVRESVPSNPLATALADVGDDVQRPGLRQFSSAWMSRLVTSAQTKPLVVEEFRQLAATLHQAQVASNARVLLITSAEPGEGKSTTAVNLALTLSESYKQRVLLLDADLRRPSLHEITNVPNVVGLGETLKSTAELKLPLFRISETLMLAPAGRPDANPMGALTSPRMRDMLSEAARRFDWVLLDAPPDRSYRRCESARPAVRRRAAGGTGAPHALRLGAEGTRRHRT